MVLLRTPRADRGTHPPPVPCRICSAHGDRGRTTARPVHPRRPRRPAVPRRLGPVRNPRGRRGPRPGDVRAGSGQAPLPARRRRPRVSPAGAAQHVREPPPGARAPAARHGRARGRGVRRSRGGAPPEEAVLAREVFAHIAALPDAFRDALVAVDVAGLSYEEASRLLDVKVATTRAGLSPLPFWLRWQSQAPTAVGAWRLIQQDPVDKLSLEPPADLPAFVPLELRAAAPAAAGRPDLAQQRLGQGPRLRRRVGGGPIRPLRVRRCHGALQLHDPRRQPPHQRDGARRCRGRLGRTRRGPAFGDDPRVFLRTVLGGGEAPGCEMERDQSEAGNESVATGWRYVGLESVAGAPRTMSHVSGRPLDRHRDPADPATQEPGTMTLVSRSRSSPPRSPRSHSASSRQRCSNRRWASPTVLGAYGAYICTRVSSPTRSSWDSAHANCPTPRKRKLRHRPSPGLLRWPSRASKHERLSGSAGRPSEPTGPLAWTQAVSSRTFPRQSAPSPLEARASCRCLRPTSIYRATPDPMSSPASTSATDG